MRGLPESKVSYHRYLRGRIFRFLDDDDPMVYEFLGSTVCFQHEWAVFGGNSRDTTA